MIKENDYVFQKKTNENDTQKHQQCICVEGFHASHTNYVATSCLFCRTQKIINEKRKIFDHVIALYRFLCSLEAFKYKRKYLLSFYHFILNQ